jgi:hypothetical protein
MAIPKKEYKTELTIALDIHFGFLFYQTPTENSKTTYQQHLFMVARPAGTPLLLPGKIEQPPTTYIGIR